MFVFVGGGAGRAHFLKPGMAQVRDCVVYYPNVPPALLPTVRASCDPLAAVPRPRS